MKLSGYSIKYPVEQASRHRWDTWIVVCWTSFAVVGVTIFLLCTQQNTTICRSERISDPQSQNIPFASNLSSNNTKSSCFPLVFEANQGRTSSVRYTTKGNSLPWAVIVKEADKQVEYKHHALHCKFEDFMIAIDLTTGNYEMTGCVNGCGPPGVDHLCFSMNQATYMATYVTGTSDFQYCGPCDPEFNHTIWPHQHLATNDSEEIWEQIIWAVRDTTRFTVTLPIAVWGPQPPDLRHTITSIVYRYQLKPSHREWLRRHIPGLPGMWIQNIPATASANSSDVVPVRSAGGSPVNLTIPDSFWHLRQLRNRVVQQMKLETNKTHLKVDYDCSICEQHRKPILTIIGILFGSVPGTIATLFTLLILIFSELEHILDEHQMKKANTKLTVISTGEATDMASLAPTVTSERPPVTRRNSTSSYV